MSGPRLSGPPGKQSPVGWVPSPQIKEECKRILHAASQGTLRLEGLQAVEFLKKSGLSKEVLREIWLIADYNQQGYLGLDEFCVACRLIAMVQDGKPCTKEALQTFSWVPLPTPLFQGMESGSNSVPNAMNDPTLDIAGTKVDNHWVMSANERATYEEQFFALDLDENGQLPAASAVQQLSASGLAKPILKRIWDMCRGENPTSNGLDMDEYCVAMKLSSVVSAKNIPLPDSLPAELKPDYQPPTATTHTTPSAAALANSATSVPAVSQLNSQTTSAGFMGSSNISESRIPSSAIDHRSPAQRKADEMLAEMDREAAEKEQKKHDEQRAKEEAIQQKKNAVALDASQRSATNEADRHASLLNQLRQVLSMVSVEEKVNREMREQANRLRATEMIYKRLIDRLNDERGYLKADEESLRHRLKDLDEQYQNARSALVAADTHVQSLRMYQ